MAHSFEAKYPSRSDEDAHARLYPAAATSRVPNSSAGQPLMPGAVSRRYIEVLQARLGNAAVQRLLIGTQTTPQASPNGQGSNGMGGVFLQRQARGNRGADPDRQEGRGTRTTRAQEDDQRRGRPEGGRGRNRQDLFSAVESDWAGRALLERYWSGEGAWDISDDPAWTRYMTASRILRKALQSEVKYYARKLAGAKRDGTFAVQKTFHAELENGEAMVGYQFLHGSNRRVGDFQFMGTASVIHEYGESVAGVEASIRPGTTVHMSLRYTFNDITDPNYSYFSDAVKSAISEVITLGEAEGFRFSVSWAEECSVWIPEEGDTVIFGYPSD